MEKRDLVIMVVALAIVLALAVFIKPILTGKEPDLGLPFQETSASDSGGEGTSPTTGPVFMTLTPTVPTPTPVPTWAGQSRELGFVAPVTTGTTMPVPTHMIPPEITPAQENLLTYATIEGKAGGITEIIHMPFPYWELSYTVNPWETRYVGETSSKEAGVADSFAVAVFPSFSIDIMDADDNTLKKTIEPRGGLDPELWDKGEGYDPRPWVEKFYEGSESQNYSFVIHTHMIQSYYIEILVPERYLGKY
ncbi:MAG TPA: hypothetical protein VMW63_07290 [Methanoregulaceae archaeon]|nr:hypothetical protein [Methanoregulaceae archaeon]